MTRATFEFGSELGVDARIAREDLELNIKIGNRRNSLLTR